jgi:hypothetical protein
MAYDGPITAGFYGAWNGAQRSFRAAIILGARLPNRVLNGRSLVSGGCPFFPRSRQEPRPAKFRAKELVPNYGRLTAAEASRNPSDVPITFNDEEIAHLRRFTAKKG